MSKNGVFLVISFESVSELMVVLSVATHFYFFFGPLLINFLISIEIDKMLISHETLD